MEPYLLDFDGDLYGQELKVAFAERLRGEQKFDSVEALKEQMAADVGRTRDLLARPDALLPFCAADEPDRRTEAGDRHQARPR